VVEHGAEVAFEHTLGDRAAVAHLGEASTEGGRPRKRRIDAATATSAIWSSRTWRRTTGFSKRAGNASGTSAATSRNANGRALTRKPSTSRGRIIDDRCTRAHADEAWAADGTTIVTWSTRGRSGRPYTRQAESPLNTAAGLASRAAWLR